MRKACKGCGGAKEPGSLHYCLTCRAKRAEADRVPSPCHRCGSTTNKARNTTNCRTCQANLVRERDAERAAAPHARRARRDVLLPHDPRSVYASLTLEQKAEVKRLMEQDRADRRAFESSIH